MACLYQVRVDLIGKNVASQQRRYLMVQCGDVGESAAEDDHLGVDDVDHAGHGACELIAIALLRLGSLFIALLRALHQAARIPLQAAAGDLARATEKGLDTVLLAAITATWFAIAC